MLKWLIVIGYFVGIYLVGYMFYSSVNGYYVDSGLSALITLCYILFWLIATTQFRKDFDVGKLFVLIIIPIVCYFLLPSYVRVGRENFDYQLVKQVRDFGFSDELLILQFSRIEGEPLVGYYFASSCNHNYPCDELTKWLNNLEKISSDVYHKYQAKVKIGEKEFHPYLVKQVESYGYSKEILVLRYINKGYAAYPILGDYFDYMCNETYPCDSVLSWFQQWHEGIDMNKYKIVVPTSKS